MLLFVGVAQAQTNVVLVSNTGQAVQTTFNPTFDYAQTFTTGGNSEGYKLTSVDLDLFIGAGDLPTYAIEIWSDSSGSPDNLQATLTPPDTLATGINNFSASGDGIDLDANTRYYVVFNSTSGNSVVRPRNTRSTSEDEGAAAGWSIADTRLTRFTHTPDASWSSSAISFLKFGVRGYAKDTMAPALVGATVDGTTLTLVYNEALDANSTPAAGDFTVTVAGSAATVSMVAVTGSTVVLTLGAAVTSGQAVTLSYTVPTGMTANPIQDAAGNDADALTDEDVAGPPMLTLILSSTAIDEGGSATVTASLSAPAAADTTVTVSAAAGTGATAADFTLSVNTTLTIAASETASSGTVTIMATADDVDTDDKSVTVSATATGGVTDAPADVTLTITDDDTAGLTVSSPTLSVTEAGGMATYTVVLDTMPAAAVTVTPTSGAPGIATVSPSSLSFTPSNWNMAQQVTVTGVDDDIDNATDRTATIANAAAASGDANYDGLSVDVTATATDDDARGVTVGSASLTVSEGAAATYTVALDSEPTGDVTVTPSSGDMTIATVSGALTFTPSNWAMAQEVTVTGAEDTVINAADRTTMISHAVSGGDYASETAASVSVSVSDNDVPGLTFTPASVTVAESGGTATYDVVLDSQPTGEVTVMLGSDAPGVATVNPTSLTFTTGNWNTGQTVTVTGVDDAIDNPADRMAAITHSASGGGYDSVAASVTVTATDDDVPGLSFTPASVTVAENGGVATYDVTLDTEPTAAVTVMLGSDAPGVATVSPTSLTFTTGNWNTGQTVTVTGVNDDLDTPADRTAAITHDASGGGYDSVAASVAVTATDDDTAGLTLSSTMLTVAEAGGTASYTVALDSQPTADVTVTPTSSAPGVATVAPASLTFTMSNWAAEQMVTVTGVDDDIDNAADRAATISHAVASSDAGYHGLSVNSVGATATDDDVAALVVSTTGLELDSAGPSGTYTVALDSEPTASVTVTVASSDTALATASPISLTFTASNWDTTQTVTVAATSPEDAHGSVTLTHTAADAAAGSASGYAGVASVVVGVEVRPPLPGLTYSTTTLDVAEAGGVASYTVALDEQPEAAVTVTPTSGDETVATVDPSSLSFTTSNWNVAQTVTVTGVDDDLDNAADRTTTIRHALRSGDVSDESDQVVTVTAIDDDTAALAVSVAELELGADETETYTVALASEPTATVTVTIESRDAAIATASPRSLSFDATNWATAQTVTVTATVPEDERDTKIVTIRHAAASDDSDYDDLEAEVTVQVDATRARERIARAVKMTQPEFLRMAMGFAVEAITARLAPGGREPGGSPLGLMGRLLDASGVANPESLPRAGRPAPSRLPADVLGQAVSFVNNLPAVDATPGHAASGGLALSRNLIDSEVSAWISGGYRKQSGGDGDFLNWNGDAYHVHAGIDKPFGEAFIGGLSVGYVSGDFDYIDRSVGAAAGGAVDTRITSVQPYLGWQPSERLSLWGMVGYGDGDLEIKDEDLERQVSDANQRMLALGGRYRVKGDPSTLQLDVKAEVSAGRLKIDGNDEDIEASSISASRWRLALEGAREVEMDDSCRLLPSFGLGARLDRGDGVTGTGVELTAGLDYHDTVRGLLVQTGVRWLPAYSSSGSLKEWAASGAIRLLPQASGRGLSFEFSQSWGDVASGVERLWNDGAGQGWGDAAESGPRLETRLGYGMKGMGGLLTPYFGATHEGEGGSLLLGADWRRGRNSLDLRGEMRDEQGREPDYSLRLELKSSW